jgi:hypothetical protein
MNNMKSKIKDLVNKKGSIHQEINHEDSAKHITLSSSFCEEKIRKLLSKEAEERISYLIDKLLI